MDRLDALYPRLLRYARRYADADDAQDIVQDALLRAGWEEDREGGYYFAAVRSVAIDHWRKAKRRPEVPLFASAPAPSSDADAGLLLADTLARLAGMRWGATLLAAAQGATLAELAAAEGVGLATIKTRIHRTRAALGPCPLDA